MKHENHQKWERVTVINLWKRQLRWCLSLAGIGKAPVKDLTARSNNRTLFRRLIVTAGMLLIMGNEAPAQDPATKAKIDQILAANPMMRYEPTSGKFFKLQLGSFTWDQAERDARDPAKHSLEGVPGRLASIKSVEETNVLKPLLTANQWRYAWIALSDRDQEGNYRWLVNNVPVENLGYANWSPGQPANYDASLDYVYLAWWGQWLTQGPNYLNSYLVEWDGAKVLGGAEAVQPPKALSTVRVPLPDDLNSYIKDRQKAILLGKALFWDMQVGSDGRTACATCHNSAGIDQRTVNTLSPGAPGSAFGPQLGGQAELGALARNRFRGANAKLTAADFPFHKVADPLGSKDSNVVLRDTAEVVGSQGVVRKNFLGIVDGNPVDNGQLVPDSLFGIPQRR